MKKMQVSEFKEAEDKRLRETTISFLKEYADKGYENAVECIDWLEKQNGEKPINTFKPKFHVGEWIVQENIGTYKIIEVCESWYEVIDSIGNHYSIGFDKEPMCYLWTIEDAKDGDVLYFDDDTIVIFKDLYNRTSFHSFCFIEEGVLTVKSDGIPDWWEGEGFCPATKEQKEILFTKMKENGYKWDNEKKEVIVPKKKIENSKKESVQKYLESLDKNDIFGIIKYGLRNSNAPEGVTVEDIYECIGCLYISGT